MIVPYASFVQHRNLPHRAVTFVSPLHFYASIQMFFVWWWRGAVTSKRYLKLNAQSVRLIVNTSFVMDHAGSNYDCSCAGLHDFADLLPLSLQMCDSETDARHLVNMRSPDRSGIDCYKYSSTNTSTNTSLNVVMTKWKRCIKLSLLPYLMHVWVGSLHNKHSSY